MALSEQTVGITCLLPRRLPLAMAGIVGEQKKSAYGIPDILGGAFRSEEAEDFGGIAAFEIGPGSVRKRDEVGNAVGIDREPAMHIDSAGLQNRVVVWSHRPRQRLGMHLDHARRAIEFAQTITCGSRPTQEYDCFVREKAKLPLKKSQDRAAGRCNRRRRDVSHICGERQPGWAAS